MKTINHPELKNYQITEDGKIFSKYKNKFLKGFINSAGYHIFNLKKSNGSYKCFLAHRLVAQTYISQPPSPKHEINHKDHIKLNNHHSNLEWVTHSENILKSFREGYRKKQTGRRTGYKHLEETKLKMADAKNKPVKITYKSGRYDIYKSVKELCENTGLYRKKFNRIINNGGTHKGIKLEFIQDNNII